MRLWATLVAVPGLGSPRLLLSGALEGEPGIPTFVKPQSCHVCGWGGAGSREGEQEPLWRAGSRWLWRWVACCCGLTQLAAKHRSCSRLG